MALEGKTYILLAASGVSKSLKRFSDSTSLFSSSNCEQIVIKSLVKNLITLLSDNL